MYKRIIAVSMILLVAMALLAKDQTSVQQINQSGVQATEQSTHLLVTQSQPIQEGPVKTEQPIVPVVTWQDNPNRCDQSTQYISADAPFNCINKPVKSVQQPVSSTTTSGSCEQYRYLVEQYSGWNVDTMMYAMKKESSCNTSSVGDNRIIGGIYAPSCGLLQIRTLQGRPTCEQLKDPATNIQWAYKIWQGQGYSAWSVLK